MFTGIVEELGEVVKVSEAFLAVRGPVVASDAALGDSISVNGCCLTVVSVEGDVFTADVMEETYRRTVIGKLEVGDKVNLERAATLTTRLGGHLVQGHVDGVAEIVKRTANPSPPTTRTGVNAESSAAPEWEEVTFRLPQGLAKYVVEKGSITVDGTSLTVTQVEGDEFSVGLIPTTLEWTTLGRKQVGDPVHIETDVVAKHVEKLLQSAGSI
ncbi:riboflavin synthase [Glycomyces sp. TRM65418]|uniref:riboflavin synthase n=1 Tax=Glycomyces sp. TRM65418 TaxID=2867006 RepID=UPI001CE6C07B|nr:riboflavin synthase [Glycomyces sp. TRM65418]MCC3764421.1 riboflavin synthase [Glycomyces sp. TRM65418]QZD54096.1 riboflavin synthase [Glycomyces sp. TRM65418]